MAPLATPQSNPVEITEMKVCQFLWNMCFLVRRSEFGDTELCSYARPVFFTLPEMLFGVLTANTKGLGRPTFLPVATQFVGGKMQIRTVSFFTCWTYVYSWIFVGLTWRYRDNTQR